MADQKGQETVEQLLKVIKTDLPERPEGMTQAEFNRLCENIARAVLTGLRMHEDRHHRIEPEFGEPDRPEG